MPKWFKFLSGLALLPVCLAGVKTLWRVVESGAKAEQVWIALLAGAACWLVVFLMLPKPMWVYVLGHELTHALWTWLLGGKVKRLRVTSSGGHVVISKNNFLIALAPYFFPVYAVVVVLIFLLGHLIWGWTPYRLWFHFFLGAAYSFHLTLTWYVLKTRQSDITDQGYLFSWVVIFLGNLAVLIFGIPVLTEGISVLGAGQWWLFHTGEILTRIAKGW